MAACIKEDAVWESDDSKVSASSAAAILSS